MFHNNSANLCCITRLIIIGPGTSLLILIPSPPPHPVPPPPPRSSGFRELSSLIATSQQFSIDTPFEFSYNSTSSGLSPFKAASCELSSLKAASCELSSIDATCHEFSFIDEARSKFFTPNTAVCDLQA
jgi:hypothetical protein